MTLLLGTQVCDHTLLGWFLGPEPRRPEQMALSLFRTADELTNRPSLTTGDHTLDNLLGGGLEPGMTHLFYGNRVLHQDLLRMAVATQLPEEEGVFNGPCIMIDGIPVTIPYLIVMVTHSWRSKSTQNQSGTHCTGVAFDKREHRDPEGSDCIVSHSSPELTMTRGRRVHS